MNYAVIGANFGDEGKGLVVDYLTLKHKKQNNLVIKHNGGAQAGHTVDKDNYRFIFHQVGAGFFNDADTYWAETYYPDLYKLNDEIEALYKLVNHKPTIYASPKCNVTLLYDVYINQTVEQVRSNNKHGSCGMGIWEAKVRSKDYPVTLQTIKEYSIEQLSQLLRTIEKQYVVKRCKEYKIEPLYLNTMDYAKILKDSLELNVNIVSNKYIKVYDNLIFEGAQGLLLDEARVQDYPHVTASCTTLKNPLELAEKLNIKINEAIYVTRPYLTRHGAGPFNEDPNIKFEDLTNIPNPWQDTLKFGKINVNELLDRVINDNPTNIKKSLFVTHLNETNNKFLDEFNTDVDSIKNKINLYKSNFKINY